jgi:hypothetical protein
MMPAFLLTVVLFVTHDCPMSNHYAPEIRRICDTYAPRGVACRLVHVDPALTDAAALAHARTFGLEASSISITVDREHRLVREMGAEVAPEVVVMTADRRIGYRGRIDDFYVEWGQSRRQARTHDLRDALDALLAGTPVPHADTQAVGCIISDLRGGSDRDFSHQ